VLLESALGGFRVEGGVPAEEERGVRGRAADRIREAGIGSVRNGLVHVAEQVLLNEPARVQVVDIEAGELRAESLAQVGLGSLRDPPELSQGTASASGYRRQLMWTEDDQFKYREDE
jgi:hypothetical protein